MAAAQSEEDRAKKKYDWLVVLGTIAGLAAASKLYVEARSRANGIGDQLSMLSGQMSQIASMKGACGSMSRAVDLVMHAISGLKNSVDFLCDDVGNMAGDAKAGSTLGFSAAVSEVGVIAADAA